MSNSRKKLLGFGLLLIFVGSMIEAKSGHRQETPSLGWMAALGASWYLIVWLMEDSLIQKISAMPARLKSFNWRLVLAWGLAGISFLVFASIFFYATKYEPPPKKESGHWNAELLRLGGYSPPANLPPVTQSPAQ